MLQVSFGEDSVVLELPSGQWYLLLRLLTDRQVDDVDVHGNTVLHLASTSRSRAAIRVAVRAGASVSAKNNKGMTPPQLAAAARSMEGEAGGGRGGVGEGGESGGRRGGRNPPEAAGGAKSKQKGGDERKGKGGKAEARGACGGSGPSGRETAKANVPQTAKNARPSSAQAPVAESHVAESHVAESTTPGEEASCSQAESSSSHSSTAEGDEVSELLTACRQGDMETVTVLLCHGIATANSLSPSDGTTPLHCAVQAEGPVFDLVSLLLEMRANVNAKDTCGVTPLWQVGLLV